MTLGDAGRRRPRRGGHAGLLPGAALLTVSWRRSVSAVAICPPFDRRAPSLAGHSGPDAALRTLFMSSINRSEKHRRLDKKHISGSSEAKIFLDKSECKLYG